MTRPPWLVFPAHRESPRTGRDHGLALDDDTVQALARALAAAFPDVWPRP